MADEPGGISGIGIAVVFAGGILLWSGIKGVTVSGVFKDLIAGKPPTDLPPANPVSAGGLFSVLNPVNLLSATSSGPVSPTGIGVSASNAHNKMLGQQMAAAYGWNSGAQWTALNNLAMSESGWSDTIANPTSNARGIAQNINGWGANYQYGNGPQQIQWFLHYIKIRYGDPVTAWNFHLANNWY
jgi:hypothetical protein